MTEDLWNSNELLGKEIVVCALVRKEPSDCEFIPVRKGKIFKTKKIANVLILYFELLDEWADHSKKIDFDQDIKSLTYRPKIVNNKFEGQFITFGDSVNVQFSKEITAWAQIVKKLASKESYSQGIFYKLLEVRNLDKDVPVQIMNNKSTISRYQLKSRINYSVDVMIYFGKEPSPGSEKYIFKCESTNSLRIFNNQQRLGFIVDIKTINLSPIGTINTKIGQLKMGVLDSTDNKEYLECPHLEIPVYTTMGINGGIIIGTIFLGLFVLSGGFVGALTQIIPELNLILKTYPLIIPIVAILGSIITSLGIWQLNQFRED
jgi:hypothetical protein